MDCNTTNYLFEGLFISLNLIHTFITRDVSNLMKAEPQNLTGMVTGDEIMVNLVTVGLFSSLLIH